MCQKIKPAVLYFSLQSSSLSIKTIYHLHYLLLISHPLKASPVSFSLYFYVSTVNPICCVHPEIGHSVCHSIYSSDFHQFISHFSHSFSVSLIHLLSLIHFLIHRRFSVQVNTIPASDSDRDQHAHHDVYCCRAFPGNTLSSVCPQQLLSLSCLQDAEWVIDREREIKPFWWVVIIISGYYYN